MDNRTCPARITGLRVVPGPRSRHVGWPGPIKLNNRVNHIGSDRAGRNHTRTVPYQTARIANYSEHGPAAIARPTHARWPPDIWAQQPGVAASAAGFPVSDPKTAVDRVGAIQHLFRSVNHCTFNLPRTHVRTVMSEYRSYS
jgi:hypothetical protein